jgi:MraZ protein
MFRGIQEINVDPKGRIAIPVRYRAVLLDQAKGQLVLTIDTEQRCLLMYPLPTWEKIEEKISELPSFHPVTRRIQRLLIGHATEVEFDKTGRILLPPLLREYAGVSNNVVLVGQGHKFEIWAGEQWRASRESWLVKESTEGEGGLPDELRSISL